MAQDRPILTSCMTDRGLAKNKDFTPLLTVGGVGQAAFFPEQLIVVFHVHTFSKTGRPCWGTVRTPPCQEQQERTAQSMDTVTFEGHLPCQWRSRKQLAVKAWV